MGRKTERSRKARKLAALNIRLKQLRVEGGRAMMAYVVTHLRGHYQYYGVSENIKGLRGYYNRVVRLLFKWLNRRSQRRSITWERFGAIHPRELPQPRIVHNFYAKPA